MDPITEALRANPVERLCRRVRADGRISLSQITQHVIRDESQRRAAVAAAVAAGKVRVEVVDNTGGRPRVDIVWIE